MTRRGLLLGGAAALAHPTWSAPSRALFDGKTLTGWQAPDMGYWKVEDGAITGETTREHNPTENQFLVWQGGTVENFHLRFRFRLFGAAANSGMQFRSVVKERGLVWGYQADIAQDRRYLGGVWDEYGPRRSLCACGQKVTIDTEGGREIEEVADPATLLKNVDLSRWTRYEIHAVGPRIVLKLDGRVTATLIDDERGRCARSGVLAMPIIPGEPMRVQYKDLQLTVLGA